MSIRDCTECRGKVSTLAANCPHCGAPVLSCDAPPSARASEAISDQLLPTDVSRIDSNSEFVESTPESSVNLVTARSPIPQPLPHQSGANDYASIYNNLSAKFSWKMTAVVCANIGIALIAYSIFTSPAVPFRLGDLSKPPKGLVELAFEYGPSSILFLLGKIAWENGK